MTTDAEGQEANDESLQVFRSFIDHAVLAVNIVDEEGTIIEWNRASEELSGLTREQAVGRPFWDIMMLLSPVKHRTEERREQIRQMILRALATGEPAFKGALEFEHVRMDGTPVIAQQIVFPIKTARGFRFGSLSQDVTARRLAERRLAESEERYRQLFEAESDAIVLVDNETGQILEANSAACALYGWTHDELLTKGNADLSAEPADTRRVTTSTPVVSDRVVMIPLRYHRKRDGSVFPVEITGRFFESKGRPVHLAAIRDLTERRRFEQETAEWKRRYELLVRSAGNIVYDCDSATSGMVWGGSVPEILGYLPEELSGGREQWQELVHAEDRTATITMLGEAEARRAVFRATYRFRHKDGRYVLLHDNGYPNLDAEGKVQSYIGIMTDITAQNKAEEDRTRLEEQLRQAQKMESIGRLAGGVAHDFNNLLTGIMGNTSLARRNLGPDHPVCELLDEVTKAAESAANLTRQLLAFSRRQLVEPKVININDVLERMHKMLVRIIGEDVQLRAVLADKLWQVEVDPGQLEQIVVNLAVNARDAMPEGGRLTLETANVVVDSDDCQRRSDATPGPYVMVAVTDQGSGMDQETKAHLFEPFFTTKEQGKGTGLGLATVYGAVKQNGGIIGVYSEVGYGTTFKIYFPSVDASPETLPDSSVADFPRGTEPVVLVEDEIIVRELAAKVLEMLGYEVFSYPSGAAALAAEGHWPPSLRLLITDVIMPGMSGHALAKSLRALRPNLRVLFSSGYTNNVIGHEGVLAEGIEFLEKPYSPRVLARKVRDMLDA